VRRRDITDLFLGTGVGARGYAVIEQGMISRIIEARPEELRVYLEEAAGVSRYKDRRRETESRIADTRDNLERVEDLRQELERQAEKLTEQAALAAQYHDLRGALAHKQNLLALARREESAAAEAAIREELARQESEEARLAQAMTRLESELEMVRDSHFEAGDGVQDAQLRVSESNAQLARIEEQQRHRRETRARLERDLAALDKERAVLTQSLERLGEERAEWLERREEMQMQMEEAMLRTDGDASALPDAQAAFAELDQRLALVRAQRAERTRQHDLARQSTEHLRQSLQQAAQRSQALASELQGLNLPEPETLASAEAQAQQARAALESVRARVVADEAKQADLMHQREKLDEHLTQGRGELAQARAQAAAIQSLLARERGGAALEAWMEQQALAGAPSLWQSLRVPAEWRCALEAVLGERLTARAAALPALSPPAALVLVDGQGMAPAASRPWPRLLDQIAADAPFDAALSDWLAHVYLADSLDQALAARGELAAGELWVCREGHRVGALSVSFYGEGAADGLMAQKASLEDAQAREARLQPQLEQLQRQRDSLNGQINMLAEAVRAQKGALTRLESELNTATLEHMRLDQVARQGGARRAAILAEREQLKQQQQEIEQQRFDTQQGIEEGAMELELLDEQLDELTRQRQDAEAELGARREQARAAERQLHDIRLRLQSAEQKVAELEHRDRERDERDALLVDRLALLREEADALELDDAGEELQNVLQAREQAEAALNLARDQLNALAERMRALAAQQHEVNAQLPALRAARQDNLLRHQEARLTMERYAEELRQAEADVALLLADLSAGVKPQALMAEIARLARAIEGMGAVNLAAHEELEQARARSDYLAAQAADLQQAMATLEHAIEKIDAETRTMLQNTYEALNAKMGEFFPTLFGGGHAALALTGEDLLDSGLQIVAQPPGKKNSTIHLLSGGEKALTAMSLVFSLFSLNPAPFCLLDEVDAPLDDANTSRFCDLVKQMSDKTQFLYISHNRLTMEMAEQLVGVTMQEQGVSRVVAVDIVEALRLREPA
jgi:chromosome segregation protein